MNQVKFDKAVFTDLGSVQPQDLDLSTLQSAVLQWRWYDLIAASEMPAALADAEVVVSNKVWLGAQQLAMAPKLKLVCIAATGTNNIDLSAAAKRGVAVCNVRAYATPSVVQHVFALLLSLTTHLDSYRESVRRGDWSRSPFFCLFGESIRELRGRTLGIIGYGELGRAVAGIAHAFGMKVLLAARDESDTREGRLPLHELLPRLDVLSLHCPLTETNRNLIGANELALMKADAVLINTARGGLVDEAALLDALQNHRLAGAALDVLEKEPPAEGNALIKAGLPNLIVTPHIAWASRESRQRLVDEIALNISAFTGGNIRNQVHESSVS
jgi:glycerate dehydrogenase